LASPQGAQIAAMMKQKKIDIAEIEAAVLAQ
jgi:hypothetical protein